MGFFKDIPLLTTGHVKGLISDGKDFPKDSVQSCLNMDFYPTYDKRRNAYIDYFAPTLPANHTIVKAWIKKFVDSTDTLQNVIIFVVKDATAPSTPRYKIYTDYYYNPAIENSVHYDNYHNFGSTGFYKKGTTTLTEITEYYPTTDFETGSWAATGFTANLRAGTTPSVTLSHVTDAYKGWYAYSGENIIGIITNSEYITDRVYFYIDYSLIYTLSGLSVGITRFPVGHFSRATMISLDEDDISMVEHANAVTIHLGTTTRPIWLGMIRDRKAMQSLSTVVTYDPVGTTPFITTSGIYNKEVDSEIDWKVAIEWNDDTDVWELIFRYRENSGAWLEDSRTTVAEPIYVVHWATLINGITYTFIVDSWTAEATEIIINFDYSANPLMKWNGFWAVYDVPLVANRKTFAHRTYSGGAVSGDTELKSQIGNELGIYYKVSNFAHNGSYTKDDRVYQLCLEIDGFQTIYIGAILATENIPLSAIDLYIEKWFDRRITASLLFYTEDDNIRPSLLTDSMLPEGNLCQGAVQGYFPIRRLSTQLYAPLNNYYGSILLDRNLPEGSLSPTETLITGAALGLSINKYLNNYYWKNIVAKSKFATSVGRNTVLCSLSADTMNADLDTSFSKRESSGIFAVNVSQIQNSNVNATSIFCSERIQEVVKGVPTGMIEVMNDEFIVFTLNSLKWMKLVDTSYEDFLELSIATQGDYQGFGSLSPKTIVRATTENLAEIGTAEAGFGAKEFQGIFFLNYESIYGFFRNKPVDLLLGRWKDAYRDIANAFKESARGGYYAARNEVWFVIENTIYIFNLDYKHWKIYSFPDVPLGFYYDDNNEIVFFTQTKIFITQKDVGTVYLDASTTGIPFTYEKWITLGTQSILKIFDRIDVIFDLDAVAESTGVTGATINFSSTGLVGATSDPFNIPA